MARRFNFQRLVASFAADARAYREQLAGGGAIITQPGSTGLKEEQPSVEVPEAWGETSSIGNPEPEVKTWGEAGSISGERAPAASTQRTGLPRKAKPGATGILFPDISMWDRVADWSALAKASRGIVAMKVRQTHIDPLFHPELSEAERRGMLILGYAFGYGADGADQADALLKNFPPRPGRILVLDLERNRYGPSMTSAQAIAFVNRFHRRTGKYPMLYASASRARPGVLARCPQWVAEWGTRPQHARIWQFTDGHFGPGPHRFPGMSKTGDINRLMTTYEELRKLSGLDSRQPVAIAKKGRGATDAEVAFESEE